MCASCLCAGVRVSTSPDVTEPIIGFESNTLLTRLLLSLTVE
jgi:hypothetical protein